MNFSANKTTPEESDNIHALFNTYMATNKVYWVEVDGYVFISAHDQSQLPTISSKILNWV